MTDNAGVLLKREEDQDAQKQLAKKMRDQDITNEALRGPAGQTLNKVLREMGLEEWPFIP